MRVIGITGGVGAGKSQVLSFLEKTYKAQVFQADEAGHQVMEPGTKAYGQIVDYFGKGILAGDGQIDRRALGALVFSDEKKRKYLNGIIHPAVKALALEEIARAHNEGVCRLFIIEAALLIEDHYEEICDEIWYVKADEEIRRKRLKENRNYTDERIDKIIKSQLKESEFEKNCQKIINNNGNIEKTRQEIKNALEF